jgi:hypothetical protein
LTDNPQDPQKVLDAKSGQARKSMFWHFPNGHCQQSAHLKDGYKLIYNHIFERQRVELYQLYDSSGNRVDWEETNDLSQKLPKLAESMKEELLGFLNDLDAGMTYLNPTCTRVKLPGVKEVPIVIDHQRTKRKVQLRFQERGSKVTKAQVIYSLNGASSDSEWFPLPAKVVRKKGEGSSNVEATLPVGTTHYQFNLIDENRFMVSYPKLDRKDLAGTALKVDP